MQSSASRDSVVRFGAFEVQKHSAELRKHGLKIRLQEQPFQVLMMLLERPGEVVTREELRQKLWCAGTFVDFDHGLNNAMNRLRDALCDSAENPRFIQTLPRRGYCFIASVVLDGPARRAAAFGEQAPPPAAPVEQVDTAVIIEPQAAPNAFEAKPRRFPFLWLAGALLLLVLGFWLRSDRPPAKIELTELTDDTGLTVDPTISEDGKLLAYASDRGSGGNLNIWIQQLAPGGTAVQLTQGYADADEPAFSPDGTTIVFHSKQDDGGIYLTSVIGGEPHRLTRSGRSPRFSPDGRWIAYCSFGTELGSLTGLQGGPLYIVPSSGGESQHLGLDLPIAENPVWSPDGKYLLVYVPPNDHFAWDQADWWLVPLDGKPSKRTGIFNALRSQGFSIGFARIPRISVWNRDVVIFAAGLGDAINAWQMPLSSDGHVRGVAERLTSGTNLEASPSLSSAGDLIFASLNRNTALWSLPLDSDHAKVTGELNRITEGPAELLPSISVDGRKVAFSAAHRQNGRFKEAVAFSDRGAAELHGRIRDISTDKETALSTSQSVQWHPQLSRDGSMVAYTSGEPGDVYAGPTNSAPPRLLFKGPSAFRSTEMLCRRVAWDWSRDNKRLLFNFGDNTVHSADFVTGREELFVGRSGLALYQAKFSPDDRAVALVGCSEHTITEATCQVYVVPLNNGMPARIEQWLALDHPRRWEDKPGWSASGNFLYFLSDRDGHLCLWAQRVDSKTKHFIGTPLPIYHLHRDRLSVANLGISLTDMAVASDKIVIGLQQLTGNIWRLSRK